MNAILKQWYNDKADDHNILQISKLFLDFIPHILWASFFVVENVTKYVKLILTKQYVLKRIRLIRQNVNFQEISKSTVIHNRSGIRIVPGI